MLPFHTRHSSTNSTSAASPQYHVQQPSISAASGPYHASQQLGSFGVPAGNRLSGTGTERVYASSGTMSNVNAGSQQQQQPPPSASYSLPPHPNPAAASSPPTNTMSNNSQQFETPRRARHPDELHMSSSATNIASQRGVLSSPRDYQQPPQQHQQQQGPRISLDQGTPGSSQYQNPGQLPGALQPGRPGAMSTATAPTLPNVAQNLGGSEYTTPSRGTNSGMSHNYTRSSPAASSGFDTGYVPYSATTPSTDQGQFTSPTSQKYIPQSTQRSISNTPLGLADIRPRADSGMADALPGANPYSYDGANAIPTNSNYLAPWAIYAFDWCKWPAQGHDAGKVAVGSYLEDGHNFVRMTQLFSGLCLHAI